MAPISAMCFSSRSTDGAAQEIRDPPAIFATGEMDVSDGASRAQPGVALGVRQAPNRDSPGGAFVRPDRVLTRNPLRPNFHESHPPTSAAPRTRRRDPRRIPDSPVHRTGLPEYRRYRQWRYVRHARESADRPAHTRSDAYHAVGRSPGLAVR